MQSCSTPNPPVPLAMTTVRRQHPVTKHLQTGATATTSRNSTSPSVSPHEKTSTVTYAPNPSRPDGVNNRVGPGPAIDKYVSKPTVHTSTAVPGVKEYLAHISVTNKPCTRSTTRRQTLHGPGCRPNHVSVQVMAGLDNITSKSSLPLHDMSTPPI